MAKLGDRDQRHDRFYRQAKRDAYAARAVYKLQEIDQRYRLLAPGRRVLDLGCRPGSWLQYCARRVGPGAVLVGLDREPIDIDVPGARLVVGDVFTTGAAELLGTLDRFDLVLSDMAPDTSGIRSLDQARSESLFERALQLAEEVLAPGGHFLGKLFQGPEFQQLVGAVRAGFDSARTLKPAGSRRDSIEQYVLGLGFRPASRRGT